MYIEQLYTSCLAEAAYYIESNGEAAIIDPLRETSPYLELARRRNATIKYVFETHFHADFVSGHVDLARKANAQIVYGPTAETGYEAHIAKDEEVFNIGNIKIKVLHTPGHTPESSCFLLTDEQGKDYCVFTGDTLFVGDVGRPDLAVKSSLTQDDLAGMLYDSLNNKIKVLHDDVIVYPAHGAGSACGKNIGKETFSTIGHQKKLNYALQPMSKEQFVKAVTEGLSAPPKYFFMDAAINKNGYQSIDAVMQGNTKSLSIEQTEKEIASGALLLDTRNPEVFETGFIPGSVNIGLNGQYAPWVGALLNPEVPIVIVAEPGKEEEAVLRLARVGYEKVSGFVGGGVDAWKNAGKKINKVNSINGDNFTKEYDSVSVIIDVRNPGEWNGGVVEEAKLISLNNLETELYSLNKEKSYVVHCAGGYRSMMAASILIKNGFDKITNVRGGINKMKESGLTLMIPEKVQ